MISASPETFATATSTAPSGASLSRTPKVAPPSSGTVTAAGAATTPGWAVATSMPLNWAVPARAVPWICRPPRTSTRSNVCTTARLMPPAAAQMS